MKRGPNVCKVKGFCFRLAVAVAIFCLIIGITGSSGVPGRLAREVVDYLLTEHYALSVYGTKILEGFYSAREALLPAGKRGIDVEVAAPLGERFPLLPDLPVSGKLVKGFGWQQDSSGWPRFSEGIELSVQEGALVRAALPGQVDLVAADKSLGKIIVIEHGEGSSTLYGRLGETGVEQGQKVAQGQVIGTVAGTIFHFELREGDYLVDPLARLERK